MIIENERDVYLTLYKVDRDMNILEEHYGSFQLASSDENDIHCTLSTRKSFMGNFDFSCGITYLSDHKGDHLSIVDEKLQRKKENSRNVREISGNVR